MKGRELKLKVGESTAVRIFYRYPDLEEASACLAAQEAGTAERTLLAYLELGRACVAGIGQGDLVVDGTVLDTDPNSRGYKEDWREILAEKFPLILIALGQYLLAVPAFVEEGVN